TPTSDDQISRFYLFWPAPVAIPRGDESPVPILDTAEAIVHGSEVISRLPSVFSRMRALSPGFNLAWILSPLWLAFDVVIENQLPLACVSLERLRQAVEDCTKRTGHRARSKLLNDRQAKELFSQIEKLLGQFAEKESLSDDVVQALTAKIPNV